MVVFFLVHSYKSGFNLRRKQWLLLDAKLASIFCYYLVYSLEEDGHKAEIGRTTWNDMASLLGATNSYEEGLLTGFRFFCGNSLRLIEDPNQE
jgi:hypothetical protein